jgi:hypothetical protein
MLWLELIFSSLKLFVTLTIESTIASSCFHFFANIDTKLLLMTIYHAFVTRKYSFKLFLLLLLCKIANGKMACYLQACRFLAVENN